jgi:hypothetical protein
MPQGIIVDFLNCCFTRSRSAMIVSRRSHTLSSIDDLLRNEAAYAAGLGAQVKQLLAEEARIQAQEKEEIRRRHPDDEEPG